MTKKSKKTYQCDPDFKELEITIEGLCVDFDVDPEVITEEQCCQIAKIIEQMSKSIWIDKTYVDFKGNHFKDAIRNSMPKVVSFVGQTANILLSIVASMITLLYMFFILLDYEYLTANWIRIFPE